MADQYRPDVKCATCSKAAPQACKNCLLVCYCSRTCQTDHWPQHKLDCKAALNKPSWKPQWWVEGRVPSFMSNEAPFVTFGTLKYLYGNVPAIDMINIENNEGVKHEGDLRLLVAASGDLRNVIESATKLPPSFRRSVNVHMNDRDFDVVARNIILMLIALMVPEDDLAAECIIHIWYSASIKKSHLDVLANLLVPLINEVNSKIASKSSKPILGKTWNLPYGQCRVELRKAEWASLLSVLSSLDGFTVSAANDIRRAITLAPSRLDRRERQLLAQTPAHRMCHMKFRTEGIMLPFQQSAEDFTVPNPTFFKGQKWPLKDSADPIEGWKLQEVLETHNGPASNDLYGKLQALLDSKLLQFRASLRARTWAFHFSCMDALGLASHLRDHAFDRIETANIADACYLGTRATVGTFTGMLRDPSQNADATLIMLYMNAVSLMASQQSSEQATREMQLMVRYMGLPRSVQSLYDPELILRNLAKGSVLDGDHYLKRYMQLEDFQSVERDFGVKMKSKNTIVERWPMKLKLAPGSEAARREFQMLLASGHDGNEAYVEWRRDHDGTVAGAHNPN